MSAVQLQLFSVNSHFISGGGECLHKVEYLQIYVPIDTIFPSISAHKYFLLHEYEGICFNTVNFCTCSGTFPKNSLAAKALQKIVFRGSLQ
jgi:hypothetical protein